jgi:hypothetical protein
VSDYSNSTIIFAAGVVICVLALVFGLKGASGGGAAEAPPPPAQPVRSQGLADDLRVVHDDQRGVTCWVLLYGGTAKGISCLGDGEFRGLP